MKRITPDELLEGEGFHLARFGADLYAETYRTPEQQSKLIRELRKSIPKLQDQIRDISNEIESFLRDNDPFDVIAQLVLANFISPELVKKSTPSGERDAFCPEYVSLLALKSPYPKAPSLRDMRILSEIQLRTDQIKPLFMQLQIAQLLDFKKDDSNLTDVQVVTIVHETLVRGRAYPWQYPEIENRLFSPFSEQLKIRCGYSLDQSRILREVVKEIGTIRLRARYSHASAQITMLIKAVESYKKSGIVPLSPPCDPEFFRQLTRMSDSELDSTLANMRELWTWSDFGGSASVTATELEKCSRVTRNAASNFLEDFSSDFQTIDSNFQVPVPVHVLMRRPLLRHESRYLLSNPTLFDTALHLRFEEALKQDDKVWHQYARHRHDSVLEMSINAIRSMLPASESYSELLYHPRGGKPRAELDGLIQCGSVLFLVEVKGGALSEAARSGRTDILLKDINDLVGKAHSQATRAEEFIWSSESVELFPKGQKKVCLNRSDISTVFLINVTLEPMGFITAGLNSSTQIEGLSLHKSRYPWMVNLYDLLAMAELIDDTWTFVDYLKRRLRIAARFEVSSLDELDYLGHYFGRGLDFPTDADHVFLLPATEDIDAYLYFKHEMRGKRASRPNRKIDSKVRALLGRIEKSTSPHKLEVMLAILDLPSDLQKEFGKNVAAAAKRSRKEKAVKSFSIPSGYPNRTGISYDVGPGVDLSRLTERCGLRMRNCNVETWFGIGDNSDKHQIFCTYLRAPDGGFTSSEQDIDS